MNREDIIRMAQESGWAYFDEETCLTLERFANLVAVAEHEACAKLLDDNWYKTQADCAAAIRNRGQA